MLLFLKRYWPTLLVAAVILYATLSNDPMPDMDMPLIPYFDKLVHAVMFGGLCGAWYFDLYRAGHRLTLRTKLLVAAACAAAGGVDEVFQSCFTAERASDIVDWYADLLGIVVAFFTAPPAVRAVVRRPRR